MTPARRIGLLAGAVGVGVAAAIVWTAARDGEEIPARPSSAISVATRIEPRVHAFGDLVTAKYVVVVVSIICASR